MKTILLSYIIPVYNGEKYLEQCLNSIINQGLSIEEYEIICADDCSKDSSRDILLGFASNYSNIKCLFNERNLKTSSSLNNALAAARGKYIWIIGQDDTIESNSAAKLLNLCEAEKLEVLAFNYNRVDSNNHLLASDKPFVNVPKQDGRTFIKSYFYDTFCILSRRCFCFDNLCQSLFYFYYVFHCDCKRIHIFLEKPKKINL